MNTYYKGYQIDDDGNLFDGGGHYLGYDATSVPDNASKETKISFAKKVIDRWTSKGYAQQGRITQVKKVGDKYTYVLEGEYYGIYEPETGDYTVFDKKPTAEYVKNYSLEEVSSEDDPFYGEHVYIDSYNNPDYSVAYVVKNLTIPVTPRPPKIGYKMPTQSQLNRGFRR